MIKMKILENNISAPQGFTALGKRVGIKSSGKLDMAVIFSEKKASAAAVYTKNKVKGAPLIVTKEHLKDNKAQAIIINSGVANVCTGKKGIEDAREMAKALSSELGISKEDVLVSSTGLIGAFLPMDRILKGIKGVKKELSKDSKAAEAILTTDSAIKEIAIKVNNFTIGAIAKGSGMVHPDMATMLCFITTDAEIAPTKLKKFLKNSVDKSFNMTSVDMDTSTSDMAVIMANGVAGKVNQIDFQKALDHVCMHLAREIARDGEGATKLVEVNAVNAKTEDDARKAAKAVISSNLVKCALFGNDPNWGRILCAIGNSGANFDEGNIDIYFGSHKIVSNGTSTGFSRHEVKGEMAKKELVIKIDMKQGKHGAKAFGCDMSIDYIKINALYTT